MKPADAKTLATRIVAEAVRGILLSTSALEVLTPEGQDQVRGALVEIAVELYQRLGIRACSRCGCTEEDPCEEGCAWALGIEPPVCTACYADGASRILVVSR